ncbi:putative Polycomb group protein ASXL3 [Mobula birostris]|uniref:putative Polycomb group protein ASXL3 n=1 Tax=Mobula birostris TaxID=1983395 RepID=UPI003B28547B
MKDKRKKKDRTWAEAARLVLEKHPNTPMTPKQILQVIQKEGLKEMSGTSPLACLNAMLHTNARVEDGAFCRIPGKMGLYALKKDELVMSAEGVIDLDGESDLDSCEMAETNSTEEENGVCPEKKHVPDESSSLHNTSSSTTIAQNKLISSTQQHTKKALKQALKQQQKRRIGVSMMMNKAIPCVVLTPLKVSEEHSESPPGFESSNMGELNGSEKESKDGARSSPSLIKTSDQHLKRLKRSSSGQLKRTRGEEIDVETPGSILVNTNLRALINKHTFASLPHHFQQQLLILLPEVDRQIGCDGVSRLSASALNNEFFAYAAQGWKERLAEGEFTPEMQLRIRQEIEKEKKVEQWKEKFFEQYYGEKLGITQEEAMKLESVKHSLENQDSSSFSPQSIASESCQITSDSKCESKINLVPYSDLQQTQCIIQKTPAKEPFKTAKEEDMLISLCSDITSDESVIQEEIAEEVEPTICGNHNESKPLQSNMSDIDHSCLLSPDKAEQVVLTDDLKSKLNTQCIKEFESQSEHTIDPQAPSLEISGISFQLLSSTSTPSQLSDSFDATNSDISESAHNANNEESTMEHTYSEGLAPFTDNPSSPGVNTQCTSQQPLTSTCSETSVLSETSETENTDSENQLRMLQSIPQSPPRTSTPSDSPTLSFEGFRKDNKDLEFHKRKPPEQHILEICHEKRPKIENDQTISTPSSRSQSEKETPSKEEPKVPPIKQLTDRGKELVLDLDILRIFQEAEDIIDENFEEVVIPKAQPFDTKTTKRDPFTSEQTIQEPACSGQLHQDNVHAGTWLLCNDYSHLAVSPRHCYAFRHFFRPNCSDDNIHLSRIKLPFVVQSQPSYQICPKSSSSRALAGGRNTGARTLADIKARAQQARAQREAAAAAAASLVGDEGISAAGTTGGQTRTLADIKAQTKAKLLAKYQARTQLQPLEEQTSGKQDQATTRDVQDVSVVKNEEVVKSDNNISSKCSTETTLALKGDDNVSASDYTVRSALHYSSDIAAVANIPHSTASSCVKSATKVPITGNTAVPSSVGLVTVACTENIIMPSSSGEERHPCISNKQNCAISASAPRYADKSAMPSAANENFIPSTTASSTKTNCTAIETKITVSSSNGSSNNNESPFSEDGDCKSQTVLNASMQSLAVSAVPAVYCTSNISPHKVSSPSCGEDITTLSNNESVAESNENAFENPSIVNNTLSTSVVSTGVLNFNTAIILNSSSSIHMPANFNATTELISTDQSLDLGSVAINKIEIGAPSAPLLSSLKPSVSKEGTSNADICYAVIDSHTTGTCVSNLGMDPQTVIVKTENALNSHMQSQELISNCTETDAEGQSVNNGRNNISEVVKNDRASLLAKDMQVSTVPYGTTSTTGLQFKFNDLEHHCFTIKNSEDFEQVISNNQEQNISNQSKSGYHASESQSINELDGYNDKSHSSDKYNEYDVGTVKNNKLDTNSGESADTKQRKLEPVNTFAETETDQSGEKEKDFSNMNDSETNQGEHLEKNEATQNAIHSRINPLVGNLQTTSSKTAFGTNQSQAFTLSAAENQERVPAPGSTNRHLSSVEANNPLVTQLLQGNLPLEKVLPQLRSGTRLEINRLPLPSRGFSESKVTAAERDVTINIPHPLSQTSKGQTLGTVWEIQCNTGDMQVSTRQAKSAEEQSQSSLKQTKQFASVGVEMWSQTPVSMDQSQSGQQQMLFKQEWINKTFIKHKIIKSPEFKEHKKPLPACGFEQNVSTGSDNSNNLIITAPTSQKQHTHQKSFSLRGLTEAETSVQTVPAATVGYGTTNASTFSRSLEQNGLAFNTIAQVDTSMDTDLESMGAVFSSSLKIKQTDISCRATQTIQNNAVKHLSSFKECEASSDQSTGLVTMETNKRLNLHATTDSTSGIKIEQFSVDDALSKSCAEDVKDISNDYYETKEHIKVFGPTMDVFLGKLVNEPDISSHLSTEPIKPASHLATQKLLQQQQLYGNYSTLHFSGTNLKQAASVIEQSIGSFLGSSANDAITLSNQNTSILAHKFSNNNSAELELKCSCRLKAMIMCKGCGAFCHDDCIGPSKLCVACLVVR